ncbi:MAG: UDP-glucose 4-epimerase [Thermoanaerobaculum sp.]|nr:MAG: UDP-glucose 4-epimerase [Thermoanaerobaculum sp.]
MELSKACVTGGAGFIGSHVAEALLARGFEVLIVDDLSTGRKENIPAGARFFQMDIRSPQAGQLLADEKVELLVHHAAQMDVRKSVADPLFDADVNILGTLNLLESGRRSRLKQVIFASTGGAMYGEQEAFPATETHPARPVSPYGVSKLSVERYLYFYWSEYRLSATCLRYANVYGPRQNPHGEAGVVAIFLNRLLSGEPCVINGDGLQTRDYVYVGDVVAANLASIGRKGFSVYNVGTGRETSVVELYWLLAKAVGVEKPPVHGPEKPGEQRRSAISSELMRRELGVYPSVSLEEGLAITARWFAERETA